jgi:hypothetical protein
MLRLVRAWRPLPAPLDEARRRWHVVRAGLLGRPVLYRMRVPGPVEPMGDHFVIIGNYFHGS